MLDSIQRANQQELSLAAEKHAQASPSQKAVCELLSPSSMEQAETVDPAPSLPPSGFLCLPQHCEDNVCLKLTRATLFCKKSHGEPTTCSDL